MALKKLSIGKNSPEQVNVFIEIPKDGDVKYELDKESGLLFVDRFLHTAMKYPFNYGFIPHTKAQDGDPLDVMVLSEKRVAPGAVIPAMPIGILEMEDEAGNDPKIVAVAPQKIDPFFGEWKEIDDVPQYVKEKIGHFFSHMKSLEKGKWVKIKGWKGKTEALTLIKQSILTPNS